MVLGRATQSLTLAAVSKLLLELPETLVGHPAHTDPNVNLEGPIGGCAVHGGTHSEMQHVSSAPGMDAL